MNVGFFHIDTQTEASDLGYECARAMVQSARRVMPGVRIVHFTDRKSTAVKGCEVVRKPSEPMALLRMRHHAGVQGEWVFVDTDVIFQHTLKRVFTEPFDIGITSRDWAHLKAAKGFTERMPFNTGVVFSRSPRFWGEVYTRLRGLSPEQQQWMGDQEVICALVAENEETRRYQIAAFKGSRYNFPPALVEDQIDEEALERQAFIVHYKGPRRKPLLLKRVREESRRCA